MSGAIDPSFLIFLPIAVLVTYYAALLGMRKRLASPTLMITLLLLPIHTLVGAVLILQARRQGVEATYLEQILFSVHSDRTYLTVLIAYTIFLLGTLGLVLLAPTRAWGRRDRIQAGTLLRYWRSYGHMRAVLILGVITLLQIAVLSRISVGGTAYGQIDGEAALGRIYVYATIVAVNGLTISGIAVMYAGPRSVRKVLMMSYAALGAMQIALSLSSGQRRYLIIAILAAVAAWFDRRRTTGQGRVAIGALLAVPLVIGLGLISVLRGSSAGFSDVTSLLASPLALIRGVFSPTELFAAHMSLYGVLTHAEGFFVAPFVQSSYAEYVGRLDLQVQQGFTIHPVAGWWLAVGPAAPLIAAATVSACALLLRRVAVAEPGSLSMGFIAAARYLPAAGIPFILMRGDSSSIRGLLIESFLLPGAFAAFCFLALRRTPVPLPPGGGRLHQMVSQSGADSERGRQTMMGGGGALPARGRLQTSSSPQQE